MTHDFDTVIPRRGTNCVKWDEDTNPDVLPLWVADMDFPAAPCIQQAIQQRAQHPVFGYVHVPDSYFQAVIRWFASRHNWTINRDWLLYTIGVVPAISCVIKAVAMPGQQVLITTPVYNCFYSCIRNNGCQTTESPLVIGNDGLYHIDWTDFEARCSEEKTVAYILCNPHNPGGRCWTPEELKRIADICRRHDVLVISDEIHNELTLPDYTYTPFATVCPDNQVTCISASKSFNIAGLQTSNIVCPDPQLRLRIDRAININEVCDVNPFGIVATQAAYTPEGAEWLSQLMQYIGQNYHLLQSSVDDINTQLAARHPDVRLTLMPLQGTYLAWLNVATLCRHLGIDVATLEQQLIDQAHIHFNAGTLYGTAGEGFIRINLACPRSILAEALHRFSQFIS